jgi:hypothetical protein
MFVQGLQELGYVEGRDFHVTYRAAEGYQDRLPALAEELVAVFADDPGRGPRGAMQVRLRR